MTRTHLLLCLTWARGAKMEYFVWQGYSKHIKMNNMCLHWQVAISQYFYKIMTQICYFIDIKLVLHKKITLFTNLHPQYYYYVMLNYYLLYLLEWDNCLVMTSLYHLSLFYTLDMFHAEKNNITTYIKVVHIIYTEI
jgi:hypothetical protein